MPHLVAGDDKAAEPERISIWFFMPLPFETGRGDGKAGMWYYRTNNKNPETDTVVKAEDKKSKAASK